MQTVNWVEKLSMEIHMKYHRMGNCYLTWLLGKILLLSTLKEKCSGIITRMKKTKRGTEESVIDYFIVCEELFESVVKMEIDEKRRYTLSRFYKSKNKTSVVESDHNINPVLEVQMESQKQFRKKRNLQFAQF